MFVLWCINLLAGLVHRTFSAGKFIGRIYRSFIHPYLKSLITKILSLGLKRNVIKGGSDIDSIQA